MSHTHSSAEEFLTSLSSLFNTTHSASHGSVYLTQKVLSAPSDTDTNDIARSRILIRATNGLSKPHRSPKSTSPKIKLSTIVEASELETFYAKYAEVCKKGMEGLRKRDKKKAKEKAKAKRKGKSTNAV